VSSRSQTSLAAWCKEQAAAWRRVFVAIDRVPRG